MNHSQRKIHLLGVPFNSAGRNDGVARAPAALRRAGLVQRLRAAGVSVVDRGDVDLGPTAPERDAVSGLIAPGALAAMIRTVRAEVQAIISAAAFPLVIGGDCSILLGCLPAQGSRSPPALLFVDGHEDAWSPASSTTGEAADMELGFALGLTTAGLPEDLLSEMPRLDARDVVVVGARDKRELFIAGVPSVSELVHTVPPERIIAAEAESVAVEAAWRLAHRGARWLHVDLDVLSTESLAAVDYRQPGGLDWDALTSFTRGALSTAGVIGWDVTIYNPGLDPDGTDAVRIVRYVVESLTPSSRS